ncbi:hypothetical protein AX14_009486 [Amanita brunnescens Koide BX004]|nr:hypothetical protein AX14_009486 [Amanita brunnescens Koide BX004]
MAKVSKPETQSQLEQVQVDCVHDDSSPAWLEKPSEATRERVVGPLLSFKPDTSDIVREQFHETTLIREPPNGSSLPDDKLSDEAIHPARVLLPASSQRANPQGGNVSTAEARRSPKRVQVTHSKTTPSPAVSDSPPMSSRFMKNLPRSTREPLVIGPRPAKASMDIISRPSPHPDTCTKPLDQPNKAVLRIELPKGNSWTGVKPSSQINSAPGSPIRMNVHAIAKIPATERKEIDISERKNLSAVGHLPLCNTALTLRKSTPVSSTWAPPAQTCKAGITPSFPVNST